MDVGLSFFWGLKLDNKVDVRNIETSGSDISSNQHLEFVLLKALHGNFTLVLSDITVHHLDVLLDLVGQDKGVGVSFGLGKDNSLAFTSIADQHISEG
jgi:hypothetical protein